MDALRQLEIVIILALQTLGSAPAVPLRTVSLLGNEEFYLLLMPMLYWCLDASAGLRIAIMLLLSNGVNHVFKLAFHAPRPYWLDPRITAYSSETSFGLPSAHAQNSAAVWGLIGVWIRRPWAMWAVALLTFTVGFSRIYLGMHFISDVVMGWLIGGLLLLAFLKLDAPVTRRITSMRYEQQLVWALVSSAVLAGVIGLTYVLLGNWQIPQAWAQTALLATPNVPISPLSLDGAFTVAGTWFGMLAGAAWWVHQYGKLFDTQGSLAHKLLRYVVGAVGVLILWYGLGKVFPRDVSLAAYALRYLRYMLIGLWVAALAPLIFQRLGIAKKNQKPL